MIDFDTVHWLAAKFGDSFYILDTARFQKNYSDFLSSFRTYYSKTVIAYSYKTNYTPELCAIVNDLGGCAEIVSGTELDLASRIGVPGDRIFFNGPCKSVADIQRALALGATVNLDSAYELPAVLDFAAGRPELNYSVGLRLNFDLGDGLDSRFGFDASGKEVERAIALLHRSKNVRVRGLHCHFPNRTLASHASRVKALLGHARHILLPSLEFLSIGGGFYGRMPTELALQFESGVPEYADYGRETAGRVGEAFQAIEETKRPVLVVEPGTALVADTMTFVTRVVDIKSVRGRQIATVCGSVFNMNPRAAGKALPMTVLTSGADETPNADRADVPIDIAGYTCIENDYLRRQYRGVLHVGDYLLFSNVGSYSLVLKPPFIQPQVPVLEESGGEWRVLKRGESAVDTFSTFAFRHTGIAAFRSESGLGCSNPHPRA